MNASLTDSTVIERHTQDLPMPDIPHWLEQPISAQTKQQKTVMDEQAEQKEKILEALTKLKTQRQQDRCHVKIGPLKSRINLAHFNVKLDPRCQNYAKAFAKNYFINQERKLGVRRRSDTVVVLTINYAD